MITAKIYAHARETPDKTAIFYNGRKISYRLFASLIERSRQHLAAQGVGGEGVAVLPTGSTLNTWFLGLALRSLGLTTLVVSSRHNIGDLRLPEIRHVVAVAGEYWLGLEQLCAKSGWPFISVPADLFADDVQAMLPSLPEPEGRFGDIIRLTSGTTGSYKKVQFSAEGEPGRAAHLRDRYGISGRSIVNVLNMGGWTGLGYSFPVAAWDVGGSVVIYRGPNLWESFSVARVTFAHIPPSVLLEVLRAPPDALRRDDRLHLVVGGGPLSELVAKAARARLTSHIYTAIASTEVGIYAATPIRQADDLRWHRILPFCEVQVVDEQGTILPAGREGQVRIRTQPGVTGYLHDEAASRAVFRDGYFYPGDLGVFRADGRLSLRGRVTDVINIRGNKSAAPPIEEVLQRKLEVTGVCVLSLQNAKAEEEIHVVIETPQPADKARLEAALRGDLRDVPISNVHFVAALPRNDMGKIQRDVLQTMVSPDSGGNPQQRRLAKEQLKPTRL